ncbi:MAG: PKD domain-containing protein [Ferruginibacter sp.]
MYKLFNKSRHFMFAFFCLLFSIAGFSQQVSPIAQIYGFSIQMSVSVSNVRSEQPFKYIVNFTMPDGGSFENFDVNIDPNLVIDNVVGPTPGGYSGNPYTFPPAPPGTVSLSFGGPYTHITGPIAGSFEINVHLPADKACGGSVLSASATLQQSHLSFTITTTPVVTGVIVDNLWKVQKFPNGLIYIPGTCPYGTLTYGTLSETVSYTVRIVKMHPTKVGAETLTNLSLTDILPTLPAGAVVTGPYTHSANMAGTNLVGNAIVFPPGFTLDPNDHVPYDATFNVVYPPMADGDCALNKAELVGTNPCGTTETIMGQVTVQKIDVIPPVVTLYKQVFPNGNLPGCTGTYKITVSNTGGSLGAYTLSDVLPAASDLSGLTLISLPAGTTVTGSISGAISVGGSMLPGETITISNPSGLPSGHAPDVFVFGYTISSTCTSSSIVNTVTATSGFSSPPRSATIYLLPDAPKACLQKTICSYHPGGYAIGDHVRFRLRVQNIGAHEIITPTITDNIDLVNLQYVGNESYYYTTNAAPITDCAPAGGVPPTGFAWSIVGSPSYSAGVLTYHLPNIPVAPCTSISTPQCGSAYHIPAYYIEFEVIIANSAGIGNVRNIAEISGSNITTTSSTVTFLTNAPVNYTIKKDVSKDGIIYQQTIGVPGGSSAYYRLRAMNYGVGIIDPVIVDLLPRDDNSSDNMILYNTPRGSNMDVRFNSFIGSTLGVYNQYYDNTAPTTGSILTTTELGTTVGTTPPSWSPAPFAGAANLKTEFHQTLGVSTSLDYIFKVNTSPFGIEKDHACNTYALRGLVKYLQDYVPQQRYLVALESNPACIEITRDSCLCNPTGFDVPDTVCTDFNAHFEVSDSCAEANTYTWNFGDGTPPVTGANVNHTYTTAGTYGVTLTWHGPCGEGGREFMIVVQDCRCDLKVSWVITRDGLDVIADGSSTTSSYPIFAYIWDFGDGTAPTPGVIATHHYTTPGAYIVTLTVYALDSRGSICRCTGKCSAQIYAVDEGEEQYRCTPRGGGGDDGPIPLKLSNSITMTATPNPFRDKVSVNFKQANKETNSKSYTLEFISNAGVTLQKKQLNNLDKAVDFNTSSYSTGIYFVLLKDSNGQMQNVKVIKLE